MMVLPVIDSAEKTPSNLKAEVQWKGSWRIRAANATLCVVASPGRLAGGAQPCRTSVLLAASPSAAWSDAARPSATPGLNRKSMIYWVVLTALSQMARLCMAVVPAVV